MANKLLLVIGLFHIGDVISAPLVFLPQSVIPAPQAHQKALLQQQLLALQPSYDWLLRSPLRPNTPLFIPNPNIPIINYDSKTKEINGLENDKFTKDQDETNSEDNGDEDSIVIEADKNKKRPQQQILTHMLGNGQRFYVGSIIESIPFLPIEINVPDSIAWAWNGISGIISGLGQRWPFRQRPETPRPLNEELLKMVYNQDMNLRNQMVMQNVGIPIFVVVPFGGPNPTQYRGTSEVS